MYMKKSQTIKRSAATGRFVTKSIGKGKASKFALVEGIALSRSSAKTISNFENNGLRGDELRSAIIGSFGNKRG